MSTHASARRALATSLGCLGLLAGGEARAEGTFVNKEIGYSIRVPKGFEEKKGGMSFGGGWSFGSDYYILDAFESKVPLHLKDGFLWRRQMVTFYFPARTAADIAKLKEEREKHATGDDKLKLMLPLDRVYQGFEEYAKANIPGFYFDDVKTGKYAGFDCSINELVFEKLTSVPQRWLACSYKVPGGEFAVMFSNTEEHFKKLKGDEIATFGTFKIVNEAGLVAPDPNGRSNVTIEKGPDDDVDLDAMSPEQRLAYYAKVRADAFKKCNDELKPGWRTLETDDFLIAYDTDPKYAALVGRQCEAVLKWLRASFGSIGDGIEQAMIVRVAKDEPTGNGGWTITVVSSRGGFKARVQTIEFVKPTSKGFVNEFGTLNEEIMNCWLGQVNEGFSKRMPGWLSIGLHEVVDDAVLKGQNLEFVMDQWEKEKLQAATQAQAKYEGDPIAAPLRPVRTVIQSVTREIFEGPGAQYARAQCGSLVRYLVLGPGKRGAKTGVILQHYMGHLADEVAVIEKQLAAERKTVANGTAGDASLSDEDRLRKEDEAYKKKRDQAYEKVAKNLLKTAYDKTFADWDDKDWKAFDQSWGQFAAGAIK